ncbi:long-chain fatty acid--CoA ligase [Propioniciclava coleopterorum]|uniref:Acyl-CoA synthetase n=1 Tax=Propioniciclava coleopterorum TaxID=2714937 RepID=A0A6G7Y703_9ACTN|nr:long-chain fatty acid--CoA ligase [Propioniciclava coleopterorum]QIK72397.1 long-chain fatty acid--CoA ligase [Propioniciclava coleopterorum]
MDTSNIAVRMAEVFRRFPDRPATRIKAGDGWEVRSYRELARDVAALAGHLVAQGIEPGDRVLILSNNRPEWSIADLALLSIRAVPVPIYPTSTPEQVRHIAGDSGAVWAFVENQNLVERLLPVWPELPALRGTWTFDGVAADDARVRPLADVLADPVSPDASAAAASRLTDASGDDLASIIYTSGTTGEPRGAALNHRGFTSELDSLDAFFDITPEDHSLAFLPLSHALERAWTFKVLTSGCMNTYVADARTVADALVEAKPTMFVSVPRLYEKVFTTVHQKVAGSPAKKAIFQWAMRVGAWNQRAYRKGRRPSLGLRAMLPVANKLVFGAIRDALGGPKTVMACGGAPLREEIEEFFSAAGMLLCQGYGLTEASPLISFNSPSAFKFGTAGRVIEGGEIRIAEEGEICYRGPNVMVGYWNNPEATAAAIDADGWLHTGDVGYVDVDGYLVITDRIKDIIVTSGGKNIAPAPIEGLILADPLFEHAVVLGNNRPYVTLLVRPHLPALEDLAHQLHLTFADAGELPTRPEIVEEIKRRVAALTDKLPSQEKVKDIRVMLEELTMDNGLLTPTLKVKRRQVEERFSALIEEMYEKVSHIKDRRH